MLTKNRGRLPDFLIIGAAKAGTTTLYHYLKLHPRIWMATYKEPCFFDSTDSNSRKGLDWYCSLFEDAQEGQLCGEASTNYTRWPTVPDTPPLIASLLPSAKLIYIMREPVQRAYSHFVHRYEKERFPGQPFTMSFEEYIESDPMVIQSSDYLTQIEKYLEIFPRQSLLLLVFEDFMKNPIPSLKKVFDFLGVDDQSECIGRETIRANIREQFAEDMLRARVARCIQRIPAMRAIYTCFPKSFRDQLYVKVVAKLFLARKMEMRYTPSPMKGETRRALAAKFAASNRILSEMTGVDLSSWLDPAITQERQDMAKPR
jgi:hypothetical protein